jgi:hypothetical protein
VFTHNANRWCNLRTGTGRNRVAPRPPPEAGERLQWRKTPVAEQYCTSQKPSYNARVPSRMGWKHQLFKAPETY